MWTELRLIVHCTDKVKHNLSNIFIFKSALQKHITLLFYNTASKYRN
jgi:hypothetical protein